MATFKRFLVLAILLVLYSGTQLLAQEGKDFWFVAPDVTNGHIQGTPLSVALRITAGNIDAKVDVCVHGGDSCRTFVIPANTQYSIKTSEPKTIGVSPAPVLPNPKYWSAFDSVYHLENIGLNSINHKGIHITSDQNVSAYYEITTDVNPDIFTLKGDNALGKEYFIPSQNKYPNGNYTPLPYEQINIVATEDNTQIKIKPTASIFTTPALPPGASMSGDTIVVTLPKAGDTYSISSNNQLVGATLAGTYIQSNKNIAVTVSDDSLVKGGARDIVGDQIVPTNVIGNDYIAIRATNTPASSSPNTIFITATEDNTTYYIDNGTGINLNKGQTSIGYEISNPSMYIRTTKPAYVYQVSGYGDELGGAMLPAITGCTGSESVSFARNFNSAFFVQIMIQKEHLDNKVFEMYAYTSSTPNGTLQTIMSDSINDASKWAKVNDFKIPATNPAKVWYTRTIDMSKAPYTLANTSTDTYYRIFAKGGLFHLSILDKNGGSMSFGYFSSYASVAIEPIDQVCVDSTVVLTSKTTNPNYGYEWTSKDGYTLDPANLPSQAVTKSGMYYLERKNLRCQAKDSIFVKFDKPEFTLSDPKTVCPKEDIVIRATPKDPAANYTYTWSPISPYNDSIIINLNPGQTQTIEVTSHLGRCSDKTTSTVVAYGSTPVTFAGIGNSLCLNDTIRADSTFVSYLWTIPSNPDTTSTNPYVIARYSGDYTLTGTTINGCSSTGKTKITVNALPSVQIDSKALCHNQTFDYKATTAASNPASYEWLGYAKTYEDIFTATPASMDSRGIVKLTVTDGNGCVNSDTAKVTWNAPLKVDLTYTSASQVTPKDPGIPGSTIYTCIETPVNLTANIGSLTGVTYRWWINGALQTNILSTLNNISVKDKEIKKIAVEISQNNCTSIDSVKITAQVKPLVDVNDSEICLNETFTALPKPPTNIKPYSWSGNTTLGNKFTPSTPGNYSLWGFSEVGGCLSDTINLIVRGLPGAKITAPPVCSDKNALLTGEDSTHIGAVTYSWKQNNSNLTSSTNSFTVNDTNSVRLIVTTSFGCKDTATAKPVFNKVPTVDLNYFNSALGDTVSSYDINLCPITTVLLNGKATSQSGSLDYAWYIDGVFKTGHNYDTLSVVAPPSGTRRVKVIVTDNGNGTSCPASDSASINVYPDPKALILAGNNEICLKSQLVVDNTIRTQIDSFTWSYNSAVINSLYSFTPTNSGAYTLSIKDKNGCRASRDYYVNDPTISLTSAPPALNCHGSSQNYTVIQKFDEQSPTNLAKQYSYTWRDSNNVVLITNPNYTATQPGTYLVESEHPDLHCKDTKSVTLKWAPNKLIDLGDTISVCIKTPYVPVTLTITDPMISNYQWVYDATGAVVSASSSLSLNPTVSPKGWYTVTGKYDALGINCNLSQKFYYDERVTLNPLALNNSTAFCKGDPISLQANNGFVSYQWYTVAGTVETIMPGETTSSLNATSSGTYKLYAQQPNGCTADNKITITVSPRPTLNLSSAKECEGDDFTITIGPGAVGNTDKYEWRYNNSTLPLVNTTKTYTSSAYGIYRVIASDGTNSTCIRDTTIDTSPYPRPVVNMIDHAICDGSTINLDAQFTTTAPYLSRAWSYGATPVVGSPPIVSQDTIYDLSLQMTEATKICTYIYPMNLTVVKVDLNPTIGFNGICKGDSTTLDAGFNHLAYLWTFHGNNAADPADPTKSYPWERVIKTGDGGWYKVQAWEQLGSLVCNSTSSPIFLTVHELPIITVTAASPYLCKNKNVQITAVSPSDPLNYKWNDALNSTVYQINPGKSGYYEVTGTNTITGCKNKAGTSIVDYVETPINTLPVYHPICYGDTETLPTLPISPAPNGVVWFKWYYGTNQVTAPWIIRDNGDYKLVYLKEPNGCEADTSVSLTVQALPIINNLVDSKAICTGESYLLDAGASTGTNNKYDWIKFPLVGSAPGVIVSNEKTYIANTSGKYALVATEPAVGCISTDTTRITVNPIPHIDLGGDIFFCKDAAVTIDVKNPVGLSKYVWSTGATNVSSIVVHPTVEESIYSVTAEFSTGCKNDTSVLVKMHPVRSLALLNDLLTVCNNSNVILTSPFPIPGSTAINSFQWVYKDKTDPNDIVPANTNWTRFGNANVGGEYTYQIIDSLGCPNSKQLLLEVLPSPVVKLPTLGCVADTLIVEPQYSYISYMWNGNPSDNKNFKVVTFQGDSIYTVEVIDKNGCSTDASTNFNARPLPQISLGNDIEICAGLDTLLTPVGDPFTSIVWSTSRYDTSKSLRVGPGIYSATVKDANGCKSTSASVRVDWLPLPIPNLGDEIAICPMSQLILDAGTDSVGVIYPSYLWHTGVTTQTTIASTDTINKVVIIDNKGCEGWAVRLVYNMVAPEYNIPSDTLCDNIIHTLDGTDGGLYPDVRWRYGTTDTITPTLEVSNPGGSYYVEANDGCFVVDDTVTIGFWETPVITSIDTMIYARLTIYADSGLQPYKYTLNQGNLQESNVFYLQGNGTYEVYVQDQNGCWAKDTVEINSVLDIDIPKFFTPNEDGYNDKWKIEGLQERFPDAMLSIYDRYGRFLVKFRGDADGWDGTYLNQPMPSDDYWFYLDLVQINKTIKGNLTLKR